MAGIFRGVEFTHAQFGRQYTTIDGRKYITYFDLTDPKLKALKPGTRIEYEPKAEPTVLCHCPLITLESPRRSRQADRDG